MGTIVNPPPLDQLTMASFVGAAKPLSPGAIGGAAERTGVKEAMLRAVLLTETGGREPFTAPTNHMQILNEAHYNYKLNGNVVVPGLAVKKWDRSLYARTTKGEYDRLIAACQHPAIGYDVALQSVSWGMPQIMGANHKMCGYPDVRSFVQAMADSGQAQLDAFVAFLQAAGLIAKMKALDFDGVAAGYNGTAYRENNYHIKIANAYARLVGSSDNKLGVGDQGPDVRALQQRLNDRGAGLTVDGDFGKRTTLALENFQKINGLPVTGLVDAATVAKLGL